MDSAMIDTVFQVLYDTIMITDTVMVPVAKSVWISPEIYVSLGFLILSGAAALISYRSSKASEKATDISLMQLDLALKSEKRTTISRILSRFSETTENQRRLWEKLSNGYEIWKVEIKWKQMEESNRPPHKLEDLFKIVGMPNGFFPVTDIEGFWISAALGGHRELIWLTRFFERVHRPQELSSILIHGSIEREKQWDVYCNDRDKIIALIIEIANTTSHEDFKKICGQHIPLVQLAVWLKLSLYHIQNKRWSNEPDFFDAAKSLVDEPKKE